MADDAVKPVKELTGRKVLAITVSAFAVIITVNLFMAYKAVGTFPGLEVKNSYVASQNFDSDRAAQEALNWNLTAILEEGDVRLEIKDLNGFPVRVASITGTLGRATEDRDDITLTFTRDATGAYLAPIGEIAPGNWDIRFEAMSLSGTPFRQRIEFHRGSR